MSIKEYERWYPSERGKGDAKRHRNKIKEAIKKNLPEIISDASIIARKKGEIIKVPIRGLKSYYFKHDTGSAGGVGQGEGYAGDVISRHPKPGDKDSPGKPGELPGIDFLETEIEIEELIAMMMEDLGLPNLSKKEVVQQIVSRQWKIYSIEKHGVYSHLHKRRTVKEAVKTTAKLIARLMRETGAPQEECESAFVEARTNMERAFQILNSRGYNNPLSEGSELKMKSLGISAYIGSDDPRFNVIEPDIEEESNAVVLAMMDISGSMGTMKKYLARSFFFWLVEFLRILYQRVEIRYIAHTTEAKLVDEQHFFYKGESGGTFCHSAYDLACELVETVYSPKKWNIYPFHFSDGEDFDTGKTMLSADRLIKLGVNMLGYGEIQVDAYNASRLMDSFEEAFDLTQTIVNEFSEYVDESGKRPFVGVVLKDKAHVYQALKSFLKKEREL